MYSPESILQFWFNGVTDQTIIKSNQPPFNQWFSAKPEFDQQIHDQFCQVYQDAKNDKLKQWEETPSGKLALIILFDQFSRNMFRGKPQMYSTDAQALKLTWSLMAAKEDTKLMLIERFFVYMPLMHAENIYDQQRSLDSFIQLVMDCEGINPKNVSYYKTQLHYAKHHHEIIAKFGRFPTRNAILSRESTAEETLFLSRASG